MGTSAQRILLMRDRQVSQSGWDGDHLHQLSRFSETCSASGMVPRFSVEHGTVSILVLRDRAMVQKAPQGHKHIEV